MMFTLMVCIASMQSDLREKTVFVSLLLWICQHSYNWNALHVADWRDNLLAMCFSHSHVMRLGLNSWDFIYVHVEKESEKNMPAENWKTCVMYE